MRRVAKAARMEERAPGRRAVARKEAKDKRKVARETAGRVGFVENQETLHNGVKMEATKTCAPRTKMTSRTLKIRPRTRKTCKHGACWKKAKMNSGRR